MLPPGTRVGAFEILETLGSGGMGRVYAARDPRLGRTIAIKVIREDVGDRAEALARFRYEARAASALNHPSIVHIYEIDEATPVLPDGSPSPFGALLYIAMEHVCGVTLTQRMRRGPVTLEELRSWGMQLAEGIARAHRAGLLHRDLKPDNVMISEDGFVKILDWGLAKLSEETVQTDTPTTPATTAGAIFGTVPYMSPEQLRGQPVTEASDVFAIGCILFEAIAGKHPFERSSLGEVIHAIGYEKPADLSDKRLPPGVAALIRRSLEKEPALRPTAKEIATGLKAIRTSTGITAAMKTLTERRGIRPAFLIGTALVMAIAVTAFVALRLRSNVAVAQPPRAAARKIDTIAVLPFTNASGSPDTEYLADGVSEHLIYDLSRSTALRVIPRSTVFQLRSSKLSPRDAGQNLSADVVLAGELLARGKELTVRAELIDVRSGALLWGRRFDESADAIVNIQEQIARDVRGALRQKENEFPAATNDPEAFRLYLRGRYFWNKRSAEGLHRAAEQFQAAIDRDPSFAQAWVGLGDSYALLEQYAGIPSRDNCAKAKSAVLRAQELDPELAQAQASLGLLCAHCEWNWTASEQAFRRAIELDPNYPTAHHWYALHLSYRGRFDEALREARRAQELDPLSLIASNAVSVAQGYAGRWPAVAEQSDRLIEMDANFAVAHMWKGRALRAGGSFDRAIAEFQRAVDLSGGKSAEMMGELASTYAIAGRGDDARKVIARLVAMEDTKHSAAYSLAAAFASLGDRDEAFVWLERALDDRSWFLVQLRVEPLFTSLRGDPRFQADLNRVHLGTE